MWIDTYLPSLPVVRKRRRRSVNKRQSPTTVDDCNHDIRVVGKKFFTNYPDRLSIPGDLSFFTRSMLFNSSIGVTNDHTTCWFPENKTSSSTDSAITFNNNHFTIIIYTRTKYLKNKPLPPNSSSFIISEQQQHPVVIKRRYSNVMNDV
ncbi:hypothetical protein DERF_009092 [Dermatophagoides farinae]|uniref:Uncharacterized protein n=1 Tax=Dermatophagoides farinae TaxID=6954 RepID=A0A922HUA8_DERFA|nr:hypothetical protein DERF_009092 [Dermatophagoides farinae]